MRSHTVPPAGRGIMWLASPALMVTALLVVAPIVYTLWLSVSDQLVNGTNSGFVGLENYLDMVQNPEFWNSVRVTLFFFIVCLIVETILGLGLGYLLSIDVPGRALFQGLMLIPAITASVAVSLVFMLIYDPTLGAANQILTAIGLPAVVWLGDPAVAPWAIVIVDVWQWTPFMALMIAAGIRSLPSEPFEAAALDGAGGLRTAINVGLPLLMPLITVAMLLRTVDLIRFFDSVFVMTQGGPLDATNTLNVYGYRKAFIEQQQSYASALQITLFLLVIAIAGIFTWARSRNHD
ncbi:MAG: carbohydrate ABC transporter permease [Propioniciclava sp.]